MSNGGCLGCLPRPSIDRLIELFVVFAGWLFKRSSSGSGEGRLVRVRVVW